MIGEENKLVANDNHAKQTSEVTPEKNRKRFLSSPPFHVACVLVVLFLLFGWLSGHSKPNDKTPAQNGVDKNSYTLKQNLDQIEALKKKEALLKKAEEQKKVRAMLAENARRYEFEKRHIEQSRVTAPVKRNSHIDKELLNRMKSSTTFLNVTYTNEQGVSITNQTTTPAHLFAGKDDNSQFMNSDNSIGFAKASKISHPGYTISAGENIEAILETAINSQLPGMVRAVTTRDIYSLNGMHCLIPKGSEIVGQYSSNNMNDTQNRILVSWTRVRLPNGIIATINSPSTDTLGRSGQGADYINRHFIAKFGSSTLFSVLGATSATVGVNNGDRFNAAQQYRIGVADSFQKTASEYLNKAVDIQPTLMINQGAKINIFVARDVSFYNVLKRAGLI